jgi:hypothetical protein
MRNRPMLGWWRYMLQVPSFLSEKQMQKRRSRMTANLAFMTEEHRRVHHFAVRELPYSQKPLPPASIAEAVHLPLERVNAILGDLESHMSFLFRNAAGEVIWAYPVTVEKTPHHVTFEAGEEIYAA